MTQLSVVLQGLRCDADLIAEDLEQLAQQSEWPFRRGNIEFKKVLRLATRGIVFREDFDDDPVYDAQPLVPEDLTLEKAIANSTEGVVWIDPEAQLWRDKMTNQSAALLKALVSGLEQGGCPKNDTQDIMRKEIESVLDELATSTSYTAAYLMPILASIMHKAGLNNFRAYLHWGRRFRTMWQAHRGKLPPKA